MPLGLEMSELRAFFEVIMIDIVLSGDNAIVIGLAVSGLPIAMRGKIIAIGIIAATLMRIVFALVAVQLLAIVGLKLAGGLLLLWVAWKMWREIRTKSAPSEHETAFTEGGRQKTPREAIWQIMVADLSMSLDNVLAVAAAAREHPYILGMGLVLSIALMAVASGFIARLLNKYHWLTYVGLAIIGIVAIDMIWEGGKEVLAAI